MRDQSTIYFPLRSNASALFAGPGVAGVRRRILAAALLNDRVVLEAGAHIAWAGDDGAFTLTLPNQGNERWQTPQQRGHLVGSRHLVNARSSDAPETTPFRQVVSTEARFSWHATFEPFRRELPSSAAKWLTFDLVRDTPTAQHIVQSWKDADRLEELQRYGVAPAPEPRGGRMVHGAILEAGYHDLAVAATMGAAVSIDRRHRFAVETRLRAGDARSLGGQYALELLLPTDFTWTDVPDLRRHPALQDYRALLRDVELDALRGSRSAAEIDDQIHREYDRRLARAAAKGIPFAGRAALQAVGFILGATADLAAPLIGGLAASGVTFAASEVLDRASRPRWLAVDRRLRGKRNGL
jgi:hypothetical protein